MNESILDVPKLGNEAANVDPLRIPTLTLGDVINELGDIKRMLRGGVVTLQAGDAGPATVEPDDPETQAAQAALDALFNGG